MKTLKFIFLLKTVLIVISLTSCSLFKPKHALAIDDLNSLLAHTNDFNITTIIQSPKATATLVQIRQQHFSDILNNEILAKINSVESLQDKKSIQDGYFRLISDINEVQTQIYEFILATTNHRDTIFAEGALSPHIYRDPFVESYLTENLTKVHQVLPSANYKLPHEPYFLGATFVLHNKQTREIRGAENGALLELTLRSYNNDKLPPLTRKLLLDSCNEERENAMIKNVLYVAPEYPGPPSTLKFLICGSNHNFSDNIIKWNKENPEQIFNLVEFTPKQLLRDK
jgi:hypothetical protein